LLPESGIESSVVLVLFFSVVGQKPSFEPRGFDPSVFLLSLFGQRPFKLDRRQFLATLSLETDACPVNILPALVKTAFTSPLCSTQFSQYMASG
jgi:hypothetical protein